MNESLQKAIELCNNSQTELARRIGTGQATVGAWVHRYRGRVGPEYVLKVSEATNWKVTPHELRPDIYPNPHDGLPVHLRVVEGKNRQSPPAVNAAQVPLI